MYIQDIYRETIDVANTQFVLSLSYGKDSMATIHVVKDVLKLPLDRIITADVWATEEISANLPPVEEFKREADAWILENYGIEVEHLCAQKCDRVRAPKVTFEMAFNARLAEGKFKGKKKGWPMTTRPWCKKLKLEAIKQINQKQTIHYLGIAADEPNRIARHIGKPNILLPLVEAGWDEDQCGLWCKYSGVLSPTYTTAARDGCWFCQMQGVGQLRRLRRDFPELWSLMLKWEESDSLMTFKGDGRTVMDYDRRFQLEDEGVLQAGDRGFRWAQVDGTESVQLRLF